MFRGLSTVTLFAADHAAAAAWYAEVFDAKPYFEVPGYAEWRLGDDEDEFGVIDARYGPQGAGTSNAGTGNAGGAIVYWHVDEVDATFDRLVSLGATVHEAVTTRSGEFRTGSVVDPFGNIAGVMNNPHWPGRH